MAEKTEKILCRAIIEVIGKPKEHVEKAVQTVLDAIKATKGLKIQKEEVAEIKSLKDEKLSGTEEKIQKKAGELFSTFIEVEFKADDLDMITIFCFEFLPSSIEIIEPEIISSRMQDVTRLMNDFLSKMHNVDMALKRLNFENSALKTNATLLLRNMIIVSLQSKEKNLDEVSKAIGIPSDQLKPFLDALIKDKFIKEEKGIYKTK